MFSIRGPRSKTLENKIQNRAASNLGRINLIGEAFWGILHSSTWYRLYREFSDVQTVWIQVINNDGTGIILLRDSQSHLPKTIQNKDRPLNKNRTIQPNRPVQAVPFFYSPK
jgi:hypothetical protein